METTNTGSGGIGAPLTDTQHRFKQEELHVSHGQHAHALAHERARAPRSGRDMSHIDGWGADLDRNNRPAVPMERTPPRLAGAPLSVPTQQPRHVEVLVSPERPGVTPVFGTSAPPRGLSGRLRRLAYRSTENELRHWMLLLLADRVDMVEGIGEDLLQGKVPNVLGEMGIKAEWRHNRAGLVRKAALAAVAAGAAYYLFSSRERTR